MIYIALLNIAIFQGIVLGFIIIKSSLFNSNSNKYLAYLLFTLSIELLKHVSEIQHVFASYPILQFIDDIEWVFLIPVFLFLFVINRIDKSSKVKQRSYLYYIPFALSATLALIYSLDHIVEAVTFSKTGIFVFQIFSLIHLLLAVTFIPFLSIYSFSKIKYLKDSQEKNWIFTLLTIASLLLFAWLSAALVGLLLNYDISYSMSTLALVATFLIHWIAYIGIYKYKLAKNKDAVTTFLNTDLTLSDHELPIIKNNRPEEQKESITADNIYYQKLESLCKEQHIYTDSTLNREKVAEKLGISPGYLSQIINSITGDNFANYINNYRIEAVKEMISNSEYENYNLLTIGLESGFTSKTTFYNSFKKITSQTPNEYKNANK
ncbi:AraC family transcriptional regulator [Flavobacterium sp. 14A]|uniref:helix-turn-helix domain-containing protein n=1 Tax=Flavobacterium sp. 14A TaxID=2735896 RepID=UPI0015712719|nr:AraC family transcriptional regulator [Flavobacterium sp. 14A]NRT10501.1 AraC-like DNA-binding protein [Flavobacterium sp. 14A]